MSARRHYYQNSDTDTNTPTREIDMDAVRKEMRIVVKPRHASECQEPRLDGLLVGFDATMEQVQNGELPEGVIDAADYQPFWILSTFDDLDRSNASDLADLRQAEYMAALYQEEAARLRRRIERKTNAYENLIPRPAEGKAYKDTKGAHTGLNYRYQENREPELSCTDKAAAKAAGLIVEVMLPVDKQLPMEQLRAALADTGNLPGFEVIAKPVVSVGIDTLLKKAASK